MKIHIVIDTNVLISGYLFINLAIDGGAKTIISGDSHRLKLKEFNRIEIIKGADFLKTK